MRNVVFITGATGGIGRAAARLFAAQGYDIALHYHRAKESAQALAEELRGYHVRCVCVGADLANAREAAQAFETAERELGFIGTLVNNAAIAQQKLFTDITDEDWRAMLDTNLSSVFYCCRAALPAMISRKQGSIVNVSSMWGQTGASCEVHYSAAKAGVIGLTKALAQEVGPSGIRVNCVAPGTIDTQMNRALSEDTLQALRDETPLGRLGTPEEAAQCILFLASAQASYLTGQVVAPNGGFVV